MKNIGPLTALAATCIAGQAVAGTVIGFDDLLPAGAYFAEPAYAESGYRLSTTYGAHLSSSELGRNSQSAVHLEVCCGPFVSSMFLQKEDFSDFGATSFDVLGDPTQTFLFDVIQRDGSIVTEAETRPIQLQATGYLDGATVAMEMFSASVTTFNLSAVFGKIDALQLAVSGADMSGLPQGAFWDTRDVHLDIDNVAVGAATVSATVPLPAGLPLLIAALGGIAVVRSRRKA